MSYLRYDIQIERRAADANHQITDTQVRLLGRAAIRQGGDNDLALSLGGNHTQPRTRRLK